VSQSRTSDYVCTKCGVKYLTPEQIKENRVVTFHLGTCGMCGKKEAVTHIRAYNYLKKKNGK
jgi:DNA-directed RNA polymerase subunit RPC12/RpoP